MGLINVYDVKWEWDNEKKHSERRVVWNGLSATNTFLGIFCFKKANKSFKCDIGMAFEKKKEILKSLE